MIWARLARSRGLEPDGRVDKVVRATDMVNVCMMVHAMRTIETDTERKDRIIADFRSAMSELRCVGSERLLRFGSACRSST